MITISPPTVSPHPPSNHLSNTASSNPTPPFNATDHLTMLATTFSPRNSKTSHCPIPELLALPFPYYHHTPLPPYPSSHQPNLFIQYNLPLSSPLLPYRYPTHHPKLTILPITRRPITVPPPKLPFLLPPNQTTTTSHPIPP